MILKKTYEISLVLFLILIFAPNSYSQWNQIGQTINGSQPYDKLGARLSLSHDGETMVVTAPGDSFHGDSITRVKIYKNINDSWIQVGEDLEGYVLDEYDHSPISLSGDGLTVAKGFPAQWFTTTQQGAVRVYDISNGDWEQLGNVIQGAPGANLFGADISLSADGRTLAISSFNYMTYGRVRVYNYIDSLWVQQGSDILGHAIGDQAGGSISLSDDGKVVAIGAMFSDDAMYRAGKVQVYKWQDDEWSQLGSDINGENIYDGIGFSVSLDSNGQTLIIGSPYPTVDGNSQAGFATVYENIDENWVQKGQKLKGMHEDWFGYDTSISSDGNIIAIGAATHKVEGNILAGQVKAFIYSNSQWVQLGDDLLGIGVADFYGQSIDLSADGSIMAVGAFRSSEAFYESGQVKVYELAPVGIKAHNILEGIHIYPNPTRGIITIRTENQKVLNTVSVLNLLGKSVLTKQINSVQSTIDLSALANGIYLLEIKNSEGIKVEKIVLER